MPPPRRIVQQRNEFVEDLDAVHQLADEASALGNAGAAWAGSMWKVFATFEMLAVRLFTFWEGFSHDVLILTLATDTSQLALSTGLSIKPTRTTFDMAEALLTATGYIEFRTSADLKGKARKWLVQSPFDNVQPADMDAADDLRTLRNFIVHRSRQSEQTYERLLQNRQVRGKPLPGEYLHVGAPTRLHAHIETLRLAAWRLVP